MKKLIFLLSLLEYSSIDYAQSQNIGLQYIDHVSNITSNYTTSNINSDFGPRDVNPPDSKWHRGIDLNLASETDKGNRIITPVAGSIAQIYRNGSYIVLVINGTGDQDYGYGHIFTGDNLPITLGNFVLIKMNSPNENKLAIIDLTNNRAFSTVANVNFTYGSNSYTTTNIVQSGWPVAPVGNSAATNGTHLHLYMLKDPGSNPQNINNAKNPLQLITHQNTSFDISIRSLNNLTEYGKNTFYAGNQLSSIKVVDSMQVTTGTAYSNAIMDIDSVVVQIKGYAETDTKYQNIKGNNFQSKIVLGGRLDHTRYPDNIDETKGDNSHVGIEPHAYDNEAKDVYYFSDFYTRIKNSDQFGGTLELANSNSEARYPDGIYYIRPRAFRVTGAEAVNTVNPNNNAAKQIIIDNFRPYISRVKIYEGPGWILKYNRGWQWASNALLLEPQQVSASFNQSQNIKVEVITSEPMKEVTLKIGSLSIPTQYCGTDLNKTNWIFNNVPIANSPNGLYTLEINGKDLADNPLQDKPAIIPIRQSNTVWSPNPTCGTSAPYNPDKYHSFVLGTNVVDFTAEQLGIYDMTIQFKDKSTASGITAYSWEFGNSANSTSVIKDPSFTYTTMGNYFVTHKIYIGPSTPYSITKPVSVCNITTPTINNIWYSRKTSSGLKSSAVFVDFFSDCIGIIGTYTWKLDGTLISNEANPVDIPLNEFTWYTVELTVTNAAGTAVKTEQIYIDPASYPFASIQDWEVTYFVHDLEVSTGNFKENEPLQFTIEYGDGITETYIANTSSYHTFTHNYYELGEYIVKVTVTGKDAQGMNKVVRTAKKIRVRPYDLEVNISYISPNTPPQPKENILCNATVTGAATGSNFYGSWGIYRVGDPNSYHAQTFSSVTQVPAFNYTPELAGEYKVMLDVNVSGFATSGSAGKQIMVENAPKYMEASISSDSYLLSLNSNYTLYGAVWPTGAPGVTDENWNPTNIRWTLTDPQGIKNYKTETFPYDQYSFTHYFTQNFNKEGTYTLLIETWNKKHQYEENGELDPSNNCRLSFYNYEAKQIVVRSDLPSLNIDYPSPTWYQPLANAQTLQIKISNPSTTKINWEADYAEGCGVVDWFHIQNTTGSNLCCNSQQMITVNIDANQNETSRFGCIHVHGYLNGIEVQGSPAWVQIDQYGTAGPWLYIAEGGSPDKNFGSSVAIDGKIAIIGSPNTSNANGLAYIYEKTDVGGWQRQTTLLSSDNNPSFGSYVDISGHYVCVLGSNKVYFFSIGEGHCIPIFELKSQPVNGPKSVAIWGDYAVVGSPDEGMRGQVSIFYRNQGGVDNWGLVKVLTGEVLWDKFGNSVDLYNDRLVVGAPNVGQGYLKIFNRNLLSDNDWGTESKIMAPAFSSGESGTSEFGKAVSVFENTISTTYYRWAEPAQYISYGARLFSISFRGDNYGTWDEVGRNFKNTKPFGNIVSSSTMYKSFNSDGDDKYFRAGFGMPTEEYVLYNGTNGSFGAVLTAKASYSAKPYSCTYDDFRGLVPYTPHQNEKYGSSVCYSYNGDIIGIPGYDNSSGSNVGAAMIDRNTRLGNNLYEAEIDLQMINFTKPSGSYFDVMARNITLGGRAFPAVIENGANIKYIAKEIVLQDGFLAEHGSVFTAEPMDYNTGNSHSPQKKSSEKIDPEVWPLSVETERSLIKTYMYVYPDLPWQTFDIGSDVGFEKAIVSESIQKSYNTDGINPEASEQEQNQDSQKLPVMSLKGTKIKLNIKNSPSIK